MKKYRKLKFKNGERIVYLAMFDDKDLWPRLEKYETVIALTRNNDLSQDHTGNIFIQVQKSDGSINCWYNQNDFITIKEYRKLKLNKICSNGI